MREGPQGQRQGVRARREVTRADRGGLARAFFRARGYYVVPLGYSDGPHSFAVGILQPPTPPAIPTPPGEYSAADIRVIRCFYAFRLEDGWSVRDEGTMTDRQYPTLADAVNAVLARLQAWAAEHPDESGLEVGAEASGGA